MTREDIIQMAREAGCGWAHNGTQPSLVGEEMLERFAALVAEAERERMTVNSIHSCGPDCQKPLCVNRRREIAEAVEAEREACKQIAKEQAAQYKVGGAPKYRVWNPLTDDGDALRLAVKLFDGDDMDVIWYNARRLRAERPELDEVAAIRLAIVRAAAEIGRIMS
jgi:hypothetical protein